MDIRFCEACQASIPDADFAAGRARTAGGRHACAACIAASAPGAGIELRFCDACHESIPDADVALGKARSVAGRNACAACLALEQLADRPVGARTAPLGLDLPPSVAKLPAGSAPVTISFCAGCSQSVPEADFGTGRAVRAGGRALCPACVGRRLLAPPRRGAPLATLLALLALGAAGWVLYDRLRPAQTQAVSPAVAAAIEEQAARTLADARRAPDERLGILDAQQAALAQQVQAGQAVRTELQALSEQVKDLQAGTQSRLEASDATLRTLDARLRQVYDWLRDVQARASGQPARARQPEAAPAAPVPAPPAPAPAAPAAPAAPGPAAPTAPTADDGMLQHWVALLKDPNAGIAFNATIKLAELKDLRAVNALLAALKSHRDFYVRLGAADALRELKACDAVPGLIEALDDREQLVQTAAQQALIAITGHQEPFQAGQPRNELKRAQKAWGAWWKDNEADVRLRQGQPRG